MLIKSVIVSEHFGDDERKSFVIKDKLGYYVSYHKSNDFEGVCVAPTFNLAEDIAEDYVLTGDKYVIREDNFFEPNTQ
jgi:hypothetical protein